MAVAAAEEVEEPAWLAASRFAYAQSLPIEAAPLAARAADRSLAELQSAAADERVRQMLGQLHLSAALTSAVSGRLDAARDHLSEAAREAATLGDPPSTSTSRPRSGSSPRSPPAASSAPMGSARGPGRGR
ncbi:hypothetical protein ONA70_16110 [Micromonospora yasonensis]|nr:hypothetical protein [Micromonospora yasonensis]